MPEPTTSIPNWASDSTFSAGIETGLAPTLAFTNSEIAQGMRPGRVVARKLNWLFRNFSQWLSWHEERITMLRPTTTVITTDTDWSVPENCLLITGVAVGGGGGGDAHRSNPSGGGAAGQIVQFEIPSALLPEQLYINIGAPGSGGSDYVGGTHVPPGAGEATLITLAVNPFTLIVKALGGRQADNYAGGYQLGDNDNSYPTFYAPAAGGGALTAVGQTGISGFPGLFGPGGAGGIGHSSSEPGEGGGGGFGWGGGGGGGGGAITGVGTGGGGGGGGGGYGYLLQAQPGSVGNDAEGNATVTGGSGGQGVVVLTTWSAI